MKLSFRILTTSTVALTAAFAAAVTVAGATGGPASDRYVTAVGAPQGAPLTAAKPVNIWGP
ncbi:hypothetical protein [Streptomyces viridosporus]|uniref:hypothetical protein n=1 Tax=Streptomyces viridosporus TaxID=67581 RepID=UPI0003139722|nr:hypothetical protein [Streptomyces viridosporus]